MTRPFKVAFRPAVWLKSGVNPFDVQLALAEEADALGLDGIFFGDRMLAEVATDEAPIYQSTHTELFTTLSAFSTRAPRLHVGSLVLVVPFRNPVQLAKLTASLDLLSGGKLLLGVGAGWNTTEMGVLGVGLKEAAGRLEEGIEILRRLWTGKPVSYQGKYYQFSDIAVEPRPPRPGGPPIWLGSFSPRSRDVFENTDISVQTDRMLRRVGRYADGWVPMLYTTAVKHCIDPAMLGKTWRRVQKHAAAAGRPGAVRFQFSHWYYAIENAQDEAEARRDLGFFFPGSFEEARETYLIGTPAEIVRKVRHLTQQIEQVEWYIFTQLGPNSRQLRLLSEKVLPLLAAGR